MDLLMSAGEVHRVPLRTGDVEMQSAAPPGQQQFLSEVIYHLWTRCLWRKLLTPFQENLILAAARRMWGSREEEWQWGTV